MRRGSDCRETSEEPPVSAPVVNQTTPCAPSRRRWNPPVFFVMLSNEKMSGRLKASMEPSSLTAASAVGAGGGSGPAAGQDQGVGSAGAAVVPLGRYDGHPASDVTGA